MELPGMTEGLLDEETQYIPVTNLDTFFSDMYDYYKNKGFSHIVLTHLCNIITLGFTIVFSIFLVAFVKWDAFVECHDESSCGSIHDYISSSLFADHGIFFSLLMIIYIILFGAFWVWKVVEAFTSVSKAYEMSNFYKNHLEVQPHELSTMKWDEVTERLIRLHEQNIFRVAIKDSLTVHDIVLRIMRKENFMIALINKQLLDIRVPWWTSPFLSEKLFLTKSLEWALSFCILNFLFDDQFTISREFLRNVKKLERRFFYAGLLHLALTPFMLLFMTVHFFLQNTQQFHSSKAYLGPRQWSPLALWKFREFNELQHVFDERILKSYRPANDYINQFHNQYSIVFAKCVSYISGSFVAVLLLVSVLSEGVLLFVQISDHNLLWYLGIFSAVYACAHSIIPDENARAYSESPEEIMEKVSSVNHHFPNEWIGRCHSEDVKDEFAELFPYKAKLFFMEASSILLTPLVLCFSLPNSAISVIEFVKQHNKYVDGVGSVCDYSLFDFNKYGNENYGATVHGSVDDIRKPEGGKLERSFLNFKHAFPNWRGGEDGENMINRLQSFKSDKEFSREQQLNNILQQSLLIQSPFNLQPQKNNNSSSTSNNNYMTGSKVISGSNNNDNVNLQNDTENLSQSRTSANTAHQNNISSNNSSNNSISSNSQQQQPQQQQQQQHVASHVLSSGLTGMWGSQGFIPSPPTAPRPPMKLTVGSSSNSSNNCNNTPPPNNNNNNNNNNSNSSSNLSNKSRQNTGYTPPNPTFISTIPEDSIIFDGDSHIHSANTASDSKSLPHSAAVQSVQSIPRSSAAHVEMTSNPMGAMNPLFKGSNPAKLYANQNNSGNNHNNNNHNNNNNSSINSYNSINSNASSFYRSAGLSRAGISPQFTIGSPNPQSPPNTNITSRSSPRQLNNDGMGMGASMTDSNLRDSVLNSQFLNGSISGFNMRGVESGMLGSLSFSTNSISQSGRNGNVADVLKSVLRKENMDFENDFYWFNKLQREQQLSQRAQYEDYATTFVNSGILSSPVRNRSQGNQSSSFYHNNTFFNGASRGTPKQQQQPSNSQINNQINSNSSNNGSNNYNYNNNSSNSSSSVNNKGEVLSISRSDSDDTIEDDGEGAFLLGDRVISPGNSPTFAKKNSENTLLNSHESV